MIIPGITRRKRAVKHNASDSYGPGYISAKLAGTTDATENVVMKVWRSTRPVISPVSPSRSISTVVIGSLAVYTVLSNESVPITAAISANRPNDIHDILSTLLKKFVGFFLYLRLFTAITNHPITAIANHSAFHEGLSVVCHKNHTATDVMHVSMPQNTIGMPALRIISLRLCSIASLIILRLRSAECFSLFSILNLILRLYYFLRMLHRPRLLRPVDSELSAGHLACSSCSFILSGTYISSMLTLQLVSLSS